MVHPAGLPPANSPFEAEDDCNFTTDAAMGPMERLALSWGQCPAVYETAAVAAEPHRQMVGRLGFAPSSRRLRAGTSLSKFATRTRHEGGVEPPQPDQ